MPTFWINTASTFRAPPHRGPLCEITGFHSGENDDDNDNDDDDNSINIVVFVVVLFRASALKMETLHFSETMPFTNESTQRQKP
jgi:hypothetical protein